MSPIKYKQRDTFAMLHFLHR